MSENSITIYAADLKQVLDELSLIRSSEYLANDPLSFCHRYTNPADQEIVALIAASFAYGGIKIILRTLETIFSQFGDSPHRFIEQFEPKQGLRLFNGFKHRFNDCHDLCALLWAIKQMLQDSGTINSFFLRFYDGSTADIGSALSGYSSAVKSFDYKPVFGTEIIPDDSYFRFLFPAPESGSACKRLCMFLRWVVRPADSIDLGIWHGIPTSKLIIPVDTHISRICSYLGFTNRKNADWRMAQEITAALRNFDPVDPVKYDFSIAHLGISDKCDGKTVERCQVCGISNICSQFAKIKKYPGN